MKYSSGKRSGARKKKHLKMEGPHDRVHLVMKSIKEKSTAERWLWRKADPEGTDKVGHQQVIDGQRSKVPKRAGHMDGFLEVHCG